jgi:hypothetical protein
VTRRTLALALIGVAVVWAVALAFLASPLVAPRLVSTTRSQTFSQIGTLKVTGPPLYVEIKIAQNPVSPGSTQVVLVTVRDPSGTAVSDASVSIEVQSPSGQNVTSEGLTNADGQYAYTWDIPASRSIGVYQVIASATKAGYSAGYAQATFVTAM